MLCGYSHLFVGEIQLVKPVHVRHTSEKTQGFSVSHNASYCIRLSIVCQSSNVWERRERDKGIIIKKVIFFLVGGQGKKMKILIENKCL